MPISSLACCRFNEGESRASRAPSWVSKFFKGVHNICFNLEWGVSILVGKFGKCLLRNNVLKWKKKTIRNTLQSMQMKLININCTFQKRWIITEAVVRSRNFACSQQLLIFMAEPKIKKNRDRTGGTVMNKTTEPGGLTVNK